MHCSVLFALLSNACLQVPHTSLDHVSGMMFMPLVNSNIMLQAPSMSAVATGHCTCQRSTSILEKLPPTWAEHIAVPVTICRQHIQCCWYLRTYVATFLIVPGFDRVCWTDELRTLSNPAMFLFSAKNSAGLFCVSLLASLPMLLGACTRPVWQLNAGKQLHAG